MILDTRKLDAEIRKLEAEIKVILEDLSEVRYLEAIVARVSHEARTEALTHRLQKECASRRLSPETFSTAYISTQMEDRTARLEEQESFACQRRSSLCMYTHFEDVVRMQRGQETDR